MPLPYFLLIIKINIFKKPKTPFGKEIFKMIKKKMIPKN